MKIFLNHMAGYPQNFLLYWARNFRFTPIALHSPSPANYRQSCGYLKELAIPTLGSGWFAAKDNGKQCFKDYIEFQLVQ